MEMEKSKVIRDELTLKFGTGTFLNENFKIFDIQEAFRIVYINKGITFFGPQFTEILTNAENLLELKLVWNFFQDRYG